MIFVQSAKLIKNYSLGNEFKRLFLDIRFDLWQKSNPMDHVGTYQ